MLCNLKINIMFSATLKKNPVNECIKFSANILNLCPRMGGCMGLPEVRNGQCRLAAGWNPNPGTLHEEKEHVPRFSLNCFDRTLHVKAEQSISLDSQSVNSTTEWAECRKHVAKSHTVKQNLVATRRVTLASEAKTLTPTKRNTAHWESKEKRSRCSSMRKKLKV